MKFSKTKMATVQQFSVTSDSHFIDFNVKISQLWIKKICHLKIFQSPVQIKKLKSFFLVLQDVTPKNFLNVLTGNAEAMQGIGSGKVIAR
jgi:hypothetical protein